MFGEPGASAIWRLRCGPEMKEIRIGSRLSVPDPNFHRNFRLLALTQRTLIVSVLYLLTVAPL